MTALTEDRVTPRREGDIYTYPVKGATIIFGGSMVCLDANGLAVPASDTAALSNVVGIAQERVDNSAGADSAKTVDVLEGTFQITSSSLTDADTGAAMYVTDDQTVTKTSTTNQVMAGVLVAKDGATKAWVDIGVHARVAKAVAFVTQADAAAQGATYDQADANTAADLANANKVAINGLIAVFQSAKMIG